MAVFHIRQRRNENLGRVYRERLQYDSYVDRYRMNKDAVDLLCSFLKDDLEPETRRGYSLTTEQQVSVALRFYATGSFQTVVGDSQGVTKSTVSRTITKVTNAINNSPDLSLPNLIDNIDLYQRQFHQVAGFPRVVGCVDGSLVAIRAPQHDEQTFVCRKGFHAINVQVVADPFLRFTDIVAKWPGSTHDSFMWANCGLEEKFSRGIIRDAVFTCTQKFGLLLRE